MFKKPFSTGQSNIVGGTDRKKLRRALEKQFPALDDASLDVRYWLIALAMRNAT